MGKGDSIMLVGGRSNNMPASINNSPIFEQVYLYNIPKYYTITYNRKYMEVKT